MHRERDPAVLRQRAERDRTNGGWRGTGLPTISVCADTAKMEKRGRRARAVGAWFAAATMRFAALWRSAATLRSRTGAVCRTCRLIPQEQRRTVSQTNLQRLCGVRIRRPGSPVRDAWRRYPSMKLLFFNSLSACRFAAIGAIVKIFYRAERAEAAPNYRDALQSIDVAWNHRSFFCRDSLHLRPVPPFRAAPKPRSAPGSA